MRKNILRIGVILLFAFLVTIVIYEIPQTNEKTSKSTFSNWTGGGSQYHGQLYQMAASGELNIQANLGDSVTINDLSTVGAPVNSIVVFIGNLLNYSSPVIIYETQPSYSWRGVAGTPSLPYVGSSNTCYYTINLGVLEIPNGNGYVNNAYNGAYPIKVDVYSKGLNQNYITIAIIFLISGLVTTIVGLVSKAKTFETPPRP